MAGITLTGIEKSFGSTRVLNGIDLTVDDGEFLSLVGASGCGKSTLLRIIAGLEAQTAGDVLIGNRRVNSVRASERDLAMVFQSYALYPHLTVQQNMLTPLKLRDMSALQRLPLVGRFFPGARSRRQGMDRMVAETAEVLKIEALLGRKPGQLSGGQRQRAALGRAMVRRPVAFLMDEPLSNLDASLRVHMRSELTDLHRRLNTTFVYVTHDQAEALTMSTRVAVMMNGNILQLDTPTRVYADPANLQVAEFIGSPKINTIAATLDSAGQVTFLGSTLSRRAAATAQPVTIGLRPEHLSLVRGGGGGSSFSGTVRNIENLGADVFVRASLLDGRDSFILRTSPETAATLSVGDPIQIGYTSGTALVFAADGKRIHLHPDTAVKREVA